MKFKNYKDEQEFMDSINEKNKNLLVDYAVELSDRFGISIEKAVEEVKRMMEAKKNDEEIVSNYPEEMSLEAQKERARPPLIPLKKEKSIMAGLYSNEEELALIEQHLYKALRAFHDCEDKKRREFYVKDYFEYFCTYNGIDPSKAIEYVKKMFNEKRRTTMYSYEYYKENALNRITGVPAPKKPSKKAKEEQEDEQK